MPLLPQLKPVPHSSSVKHTCAAPAGQLAAQLDVVPLLPPPWPPGAMPAPAAGAFGARQHTCPPSQLAALEQDVMVTVPVGQASALAWHVAALAP